MTVEELRKSGLIAYEYIRGSHCHGIATETSDVDISGVYFAPLDTLLGLRSEYQEQVSDAKGDVVFYEFGRWIELLLKSNPTVLEGLFVDKKFIVGEVHPIIQTILDNRDKFLSKDVFAPLLGYSTAQIHKARGLHKKCNYPEDMARKGVLDFCYVPEAQGATHIERWLAERGLMQKYVGLVKLPNMQDMYGLYYDWGTHLICEYGADLKDKNEDNLDNVWDKLYEEMDNNDSDTISTFADSLTNYCLTSDYATYRSQLEYVQPYGFRGIVNDNSDSNEVRVCSVPKGIKPLAYMSYNETGYNSHCKDYNEWKEWKENRNPVRYESNKGKTYDAKNMCECTRLIHTGIELAEGKGFNVERTWDRDFLLSIKKHEKEYDEIIEYINDKKEYMDKIVKDCTLPDHVNMDEIKKLIKEARHKFYNI